MAKFKAKVKDCRLVVKVKLSSKEEISGREMNLIEKNTMRGFLNPQQTKKNVIEYTGPVGISLKERMNRPISQYDLFFIVAQVVNVFRTFQNNTLFINKLVLDNNCIYINEATKEVSFIYLPVETPSVAVDLIGFINSIIYSVVPNPGESTDYLSKFSFFINGLKSFDADEIDNYIAKYDKGIINIIRRHNIGGSGFITDKPLEYLKHYEEPIQISSSSDYEKGTAPLDEGTALLREEGTGLLEENLDEGTALLKESVRYPKLLRVATDEKTEINKPTFRVGKEKSYVDLFIANNGAVSRSHADIITRGDRYYIIDLNSTNHTYISSRKSLL